MVETLIWVLCSTMRALGQQTVSAQCLKHRFDCLQHRVPVGSVYITIVGRAPATTIPVVLTSVLPDGHHCRFHFAHKCFQVHNSTTCPACKTYSSCKACTQLSCVIPTGLTCGTRELLYEFHEWSNVKQPVSTQWFVTNCCRIRLFNMEFLSWWALWQCRLRLRFSEFRCRGDQWSSVAIAMKPPFLWAITPLFWWHHLKYV